MAQILFLSRNQIEALLDLKKVIPAIETGFGQDAESKVLTFPVVRESLEDTGGIFGIKSGYIPKEQLLGYKAGGYWKTNLEKGVPGHQSLIVLYNPQTGIPKAVMDGNFITIIRTGAAGAIAAKYLARKNAKKLGVVGTGVQGRIQTLALKEVLSLEEISFFDENRTAREQFQKQMTSQFPAVKLAKNVEEAVIGNDILITATPSFRFIVREEWIDSGMHINAIGADTRGKQELEPSILQKAKVVVDNRVQSGTIGECQHAIGLGLIDESKIHAELGEIVLGRKSGRTSPEEITLFDATGVAFQDLITAGLAYNLAVKQKVGQLLDV